MADVRRLVELGMVPHLAKEVAAQITSGVGNARRLAELSMVPSLARELAAQITAKVGNARRLAELSMVPVLAREVAGQLGGGFTIPNNYYFASNQTRSPNQMRSAGTAIYQLPRKYMGRAPFDMISPRVAYPSHYTNTSNLEIAATHTLLVYGISIGYSTTKDPTTATWVTGKFAGQDGITIDPTVNSVGVLSDDYAVTIPAGYYWWTAISFSVPSGGSFPQNYNFAPSQSLEGVASSTTTPQTAKLTDGSVITNGAVAGNGYGPSYVVCKGFDGRPSFLVWGDSIGFGENETGYTQTDGIKGYISRGLEEDTLSKKMLSGNHCIPGSGPHYWLTNGRSAVAKKLDLIALVPNVPFSHILHEGGTNSTAQAGWSTNMVTSMTSFYTSCLNAEWPGKPIIQCTMLPKGATTDGWQTAANQTPTTGFAAGGNVDLFNQAVVAGTLPGASGYVDGAPAVTSPGNIGKWLTDPFITTLAADYVSSSTTIVLTDNPGVGKCIVLDPDTSGSAGQGQVVRLVTGSGPYTCTLINGFAYAKTTGAKVTGSVTQDGTHPVVSGHLLSTPATISMKNRIQPI